MSLAICISKTEKETHSGDDRKNEQLQNWKAGGKERM